MGEFTSAAVALEGVLADIREGRGPELWRGTDANWNGVELGPGLVCILAGAPGAGKSTLAMQWACDALLRNENLSAFIANGEMSKASLVRRLLARYSGISARDIRFATLDKEDKDRFTFGLRLVSRFAERLHFYEGAFSVDAILEALRAGNHGVGLFVLDYVQICRLDANGQADGRRQEIDSIMAGLRDIADNGAGVLAVSAVARQKSSTGSTYSTGLNLASFKDSGGLEYAADSAWILTPGSDGNEKNAGIDGLMVCQCVKNRHGETPSLPVVFDRRTLNFLPVKGDT